jgi:transcriptional regulator with XRE-family HTH domain
MTITLTATNDIMSAPMDTKDNFAWVEWIVAEREKREWSQSDLARKVGVTRQTINDYESRRRTNPDEKILVKISQTFGYPPEFLSRLAGQLPPALEMSEEMEQIMREVEKLPKDDQQEVLAFIRMKRNLRKSK